jgi:hypothetical protein
MASATWPRWSRDVDPGRSRMAGAPAVRQPVQDGVPRGVSVIQRRQPSSGRRLSRSRCRHADARTFHSPSSRRYTWVARRGIAAGDRRSKPRSARGRRCFTPKGVIGECMGQTLAGNQVSRRRKRGRSWLAEGRHPLARSAEFGGLSATSQVSAYVTVPGSLQSSNPRGSPSLAPGPHPSPHCNA